MKAEEDIMNRISFALKDPVLQMGFEVICSKLAELEKEKCELLGIIQGKDKVIQELKKELNSMLVSKNQQLAKAKEIIKKFSEFVNNEVEFDPEHPQEHTDLWNELCEKAEQFLKESE